MALRSRGICFDSIGRKNCIGIFIVLVIINVTAFILFVTSEWKTQYDHGKYSELGQRIGRARWGKYNSSTLSKDVMDTLEYRLKKATEEKIIIMWYPPFGDKPQFSVDSSYCGNCVISYDRSLIKESKTAAVVFHFNEISPATMPTSRKPDQLHIFWTMETPSTLKHLRNRKLLYEDEYGFNATASYRRDADFLTSYGRSRDIVKKFFEDTLNSKTQNLIKIKTKTAIAVVSNCGLTVGAKRRLSLLQQIKDHGFNLETYGNCFNKPLPKGKDFFEILKPYKFYFAFENSYHCRDYITEKFLGNGLLSGALPIVWGAKKEDYEVVAPPNSFIHVEDFNSIKELVGYLDYLNKNDTAYFEYFRWYELLGKNTVKRKEFLCHICRAVHGINVDDVFHPNYDPGNPVRPLFVDHVSRRTASIRKWFYDTEDPDCLKTVL